MLYVTGADWFCMCDRAGPEAPAQEHRCLSEAGDCLRPGSAHKLLLASPGLAFVAHSFLQLQLFPCCCQSMCFSLTTWSDCGSHMGWGGGGVSFTPCVNHLPTPPVGHSEALHLFCFQFPHK